MTKDSETLKAILEELKSLRSVVEAEVKVHNQLRVARVQLSNQQVGRLGEMILGDIFKRSANP